MGPRRFYKDTAGTANLTKGMEKVRAELQHMSARTKISHGLCLIKSFFETAGDRDVLLASLMGAFEECRGLHVDKDEASVVLKGVVEISHMAEVSHQHVKLASSILSLIPESMLSDGTGDPLQKSQAGLTAVELAGTSAVAEASVKMWMQQFSRTSAGWDVSSIAAELDEKSTLTVVDVAKGVAAMTA